MSEYRACRTCGGDLVSDGRGFGANECCCDRGFCHEHCPEDVAHRFTSAADAIAWLKDDGEDGAGRPVPGGAGVAEG